MLITGTVASFALMLTQAPAQDGGDALRSEEAIPAPLNFLIVLLDDVGRDKMGLYGVGTDPPATPHLDALAARGVVFEHAWAAQSCSPARAALLTGRSSDRTGMGAVIRPDDDRETSLPLTEHLIPEDLPGYVTTHVGKWHLGDREAGVDHPRLSGFDHSIRWRGKNDYFQWTEYVDDEATKKAGYFPASMGEHVSRAVGSTEAPFFVYYATKLGHTPYHDPPEEYRSQKGPLGYALRQHKGMVEAIDTVLGRVLADVDLSTTYVIVLGDNGSPGHTVEAPFSLKKNKNSLYETGLNVPFIVAGPGVARGQRCGELVSVTDIFATVRDLAGLGAPSRGAEDSVSFASLLRDPKGPSVRDALYIHRFPHKGAPGPDQRAVRNRRWKLIQNVRTGEYEFYDLQADPFEASDLAQRALDETAEDKTLAKAMVDLQGRFPALKAQAKSEAKK